MAYTLMKSLINSKRKSAADLRKKANVFYACEELNDEEYMEIMNLIDAM